MKILVGIGKKIQQLWCCDWLLPIASIHFFIFLINLSFSFTALSRPFSVLGSVGYESLTIGSGNANSVRPGDPSGVSLSLGISTNILKFQKMFLFAAGDLDFLRASGTRSAGDTNVESSLGAFFLGGSGGIRIPIRCCILLEAGMGLDYAIWSNFSYKATVQGYVPITSDEAAQGLWRIKVFLRGAYKFKRGLEVGLDLGSNFGSFSWMNTGTSELQKDSFTAVSVKLSGRYWIGDAEEVKIAYGQKYQREPQTSSSLPPTWDENNFGAAKPKVLPQKKAKNKRSKLIPKSRKKDDKTGKKGKIPAPSKNLRKKNSNPKIK